MRWTADAIPDQSGRIALVTGANSGLGLETTRALAARGATVVLACRSLAKAHKAREELLTTAASTGAIDVLLLDLADLASVAAAARTVCERYGRLDLLINNAGVMAPPRTLTRDGFELQFGTNHLGHFALSLALLPLLRDQPGARVVTVTSGAQYFGRIAFDDLQGERHYDRWRCLRPEQARQRDVRPRAAATPERPRAAMPFLWPPIPVSPAPTSSRPPSPPAAPGSSPSPTG